MTEVRSPTFVVDGALRFGRVGQVTPVDIPASGVLKLDVSSGSAVTLGGGGALELVGIEYVTLDSQGNEVDVVIDQDQADVKFIRTAPGVTVTVGHNRTQDLLMNALSAERRILTSSGKDYPLEGINAQAFWSYAQAAGGFRWFFVHRLNFDPSDTLDWETTPKSLPEALDELGERAPLRTNGSASILSGVPEDVWAYTLAPGEVIAVSVTVLAHAELVGVTSSSVARTVFTASRDDLGAAVVTVLTEDIAGTLTGGTIATVAVGNDVIVRLSFLLAVTLTWVARAELDSLTP